MNTFVVALFAALACTAQAGLLPLSHGQILQGPSSRTTIVGNDGSAISAVQPGGTIITEEHAGYAAHSAPVLAHSAPVIAHSVPVLAHSAPVIAHSAPVLAHAAPIAYAAAPVAVAHGVVSHGVVAHGLHNVDSDAVIAGPSGTVVRSNGIVGTAHAAPLAHQLW